jgi:1,4-alpha-glucan branching enzyme
MSSLTVQFRYLTGLKRAIFSNARLVGSWDAAGRLAASWSDRPMVSAIAEDGCPCFTATVSFDADEIGKNFRWGVRLDGPAGNDLWAIPTEVNDMNSAERYREFVLTSDAADQKQDFYFTYARRFGARKYFAPGASSPGLRFSVWAPYAQKIDVVFGKANNGYIADDGDGIDPTRPVFSLQPTGGGIWQSEVIPHFAAYQGSPYMYRIQNAVGQTVFRTDLYSRNQLGRGGYDPKGQHFAGAPADLNGAKGCSLIKSLDSVTAQFDGTGARIPEADFWASEFTPGMTVPTRIEDMVIYELHVNALATGDARPGSLRHALDFLPHLVTLGVNAVELLPMCEFSGAYGWGYGDTHYFTIESAAGTRDQYKHFVRECHRNGIAVIQDVCYNHFDDDAERAEWAYDSPRPEENIYYWYEGRASDYPSSDGGYVDNGSTGFTPRFWEEPVRHLFVSSAAAFVEEFHVDGLRVDLTQAIHRDNVLHGDPSKQLGNVNLFGQKMLREWSRTISLIRPSAVLIAEDHTGWPAVTQTPDTGGLGFRSTWDAAFYHNLIGDSDMAGGRARLLKEAGQANDGGLDFEQFAAALYESRYDRVVYHESHDEAGNAGGTARTIVTAVNGAALIGPTRDYAEARCRVVAGMSMLSAGTPMFFMAEEVGAQKPYDVLTFLDNREEIAELRRGSGANLFGYYRDLIRFTRSHAAARSTDIDIVHVLGANRLIAFVRSSGTEQLLVIACLRNQPFLDGYVVQTDSTRLPDGQWREVFNSDATTYGGAGIGNFGADVPAVNGRFQARIPANGLLVFQKL